MATKTTQANKLILIRTVAQCALRSGSKSSPIDIDRARSRSTVNILIVEPPAYACKLKITLKFHRKMHQIETVGEEMYRKWRKRTETSAWHPAPLLANAKPHLWWDA